LMLPGIAGFMVAAFGGGDGNIDPAKWVYLVMMGLYFSSVVLLFKVVVADKTPHVGELTPILTELKLGFQYVLRTPIILMLLMCNFAMVFFSLTYFMLLPGFAKDVLGAGPDDLGLMISISGIGSLVGSLLVASMPNRNRARTLLAGALVLGIALLAFAWSTNYWLSVFFLTFVGLGQAARMSLSNVLIQSYVEDEFRGRVMSIYMLEMSLLSVAIYPISVMADLIGPQITVGISAVCLIVLVLGLFTYPTYRNLD
jgi:predicted MFS family arabinose efflux permease